MLKTDEINLDYILSLILEKAKESEDVENLQIEVRRVIRSSLGTRAKYQVDRLISYHNALVEIMTGKVQELPRENFAVRQHLKYVDLYSNEVNYLTLIYEDTLIMREELAPLILPNDDEASAVRFDALMYGIELACLVGKNYGKAHSDLFKCVRGDHKRYQYSSYQASL